VVWQTIKATLFNHPGCPWGYSANPALRVLEWRYGDQIEWRLVVIGLRDEVTEQMEQQFDPAGVTRLMVFRTRYGMPFSLQPKARAAATGRGCRAVVAARLLSPGSEFRVMRALQFANFTTALLLDDDEQIRDALAPLPAIGAARNTTQRSLTHLPPRRHAGAARPRARRRCLSPVAWLAGDLLDCGRQLACRKVSERNVLEHSTDVRAKGDPHILQGLRRRVVGDGRRPDASHGRERPTDGAHHIGDSDLTRRSREPKSSVSSSLGLDDLSMSKLNQDVLEKRRRDVLCLSDLFAA